MAESQSLEDRLRSHARAFDGLLALIPAKEYYREDTSDQWQRKKQTKEEARAAKMAKLDPSNNKSALDVIQENDRKRKREEAGEDVSKNDNGLERPLEGLKAPKQPRKPNVESVDPDIAREAKADRQKQKMEAKKVRKEAKQAKQKAKKEATQRAKAGQADEEDEDDDDEDEEALQNVNGTISFLGGADLTADATEPENDKTSRSTKSAKTEVLHKAASSTSSSDSQSPFDFSTQPSGTSSISSNGTTNSAKEAGNTAIASNTDKTSSGSSLLGKSNIAPKRSMEEMQERLRKIIAEKRAQRGADVDGRPAKTRAELLESRRAKQESRKARKKALRQQAKEEEIRQRDESLARGSPLMSPSIRSPPYGDDTNNFAFGRIAFENGQSMTADLNASLDLSKRKGPSDVKTALLKVGAKDARLAAMAPGKRAEAEEKSMWLNASKRAHGEKVRDDSNLLKKALKRKQKQKDKSTNDWQKRLAGIKASQDAKQRKREENLTKRKEEKGKKGSKSSKVKKPKKRPGFEGSLRSGGRK